MYTNVNNVKAIYGVLLLLFTFLFIMNNLEGYGRYHYLDRLRFLYIARGSLSETLSAFIIAQTLGYCTDAQLDWSRELKQKIEKNLNGYCRFIKKQQQGGSEYGQQYIQS